MLEGRWKMSEVRHFVEYALPKIAKHQTLLRLAIAFLPLFEFLNLCRHALGEKGFRHNVRYALRLDGKPYGSELRQRHHPRRVRIGSLRYGLSTLDVRKSGAGADNFNAVYVVFAPFWGVKSAFFKIFTQKILQFTK